MPITIRYAALATLWCACADPGSGSTHFVGGDADAADAIDAVDDIAETPDVGEVTPPNDACEPGIPCSDRDPCTVDDRCVAGTCKGDPIVCDDGVTCTLDRCMGGVCRHEVADGFCRLDGACYDQGQPNPLNPCQRCDATVSRGTWTSMDGLKCQDGDPCTTGETCLEGLCEGFPVDSPDCLKVDPTPLPTCTTHFDCYPEKVCARTDGLLHCVPPCGSAADCQSGEICTKLPGSANIGYCEIAKSGLGEGEACRRDADCQSQLCAEGQCRTFCLSEGDCLTPGHTCRGIGARGDGRTISACLPDGSLKAIGQACTNGLEYHANQCASAHCDLVPYGTVGPQALLPCAPLCQREQDCGFNQECGVVMYGEFPSVDATPFHPQNQSNPRSAITACYSRNGAVSSLPSGTPCTSPTQCGSNKCLHLIPADPQRYCSGYCATDSDCPASMQCKPDLITLASDWLQTPWITTQGPSLQQQTLVRVCKFR
jgi:hypothetical protein